MLHEQAISSQVYNKIFGYLERAKWQPVTEHVCLSE